MSLNIFSIVNSLPKIKLDQLVHALTTSSCSMSGDEFERSNDAARQKLYNNDKRSLFKAERVQHSDKGTTCEQASIIRS